jgi:ADP-ribose pyrophosphatase YjhB (NUDIX family)
VERGETLHEALVREMREETGLAVEPLEVLTVFDRIEAEGKDVTFHYVIVDYRCRWRGGEARAGSDALEVRWAGPGELEGLDLTAKAREVVLDAFRRAGAEELASGPEEE